jgi:hypothetical protein
MPDVTAGAHEKPMRTSLTLGLDLTDVDHTWTAPR